MWACWKMLKEMGSVKNGKEFIACDCRLKQMWDGRMRALDADFMVSNHPHFIVDCVDRRSAGSDEYLWWWPWSGWDTMKTCLACSGTWRIWRIATIDSGIREWADTCVHHPTSVLSFLDSIFSSCGQGSIPLTKQLLEVWTDWIGRLVACVCHFSRSLPGGGLRVGRGWKLKRG